MYVGHHNHLDDSNYRLLDSTISVEELFEVTLQKGHKGVTITDHETVGSHIKALHLLQNLKQKDPEKWNNYKLMLGNEIYLCNRKQIQEEKNYKFPHFILIAKNYRGHQALKELSTIAWCENSFMWVNMRVPTFYDDLIKVMKEYKGDVVASTACAGGSLPQEILRVYNENPKNPNLERCKLWIQSMKKIFGDENFFLELQPSVQEEQKIINKYLVQLSEETNTHYIITTDAHYALKEDRKVHEAFLNSQEADREVGDFYATTYIMSEQEIHEYLDEDLGYDVVQKGIDNTMIIYDMCEEYSLDAPLDIPYMPSNITEPDEIKYNEIKDKIPLLEYFYHSQHKSDRHLVREIIDKIYEKPEEFNNQKAFDSIQICLESIKLSSEKQGTPWSAYLLQTKDIVDVCWDSGSLVGPLRGSAGGFVLLYLLGVIQVSALKEEAEMFHWRFLNPERVSPLDIDIDVIGSMRDTIIKNLQEKYGGYRHVTKVQTILKAKAKNALQIACRGLGYPPETGIFLGSFIKAERGLQFSLKQTYYGDENEGLSPDKEFVNLMNDQYPDIWEVAQRIEGLCVGVGQHAGGVILSDKDIVKSVALMKVKNGDVITQFDLHEAEACGLIKWDLLGIDALGKIKTELDLLIEDGLIVPEATLKETYEKYLGVYNIERNNHEIWDMVNRHEILSLFQFEKQSGYQSIELGKPRNLEEMSALNSVMRLMAPEGSNETPLQRYSRFNKDITLWYKEMEEYGLTAEEQEFCKKYASKSYGLLPNQENFMIIVQDPEVGGFNLLWADLLRKSIAKKNPEEFQRLQEEFYKNMKEKQLSEKLCHYVWDILISMNKGYGFNLSHTLGYSIVGLQEANLAYRYPMVYWNCANLISDSGGEEGTVNYGKIATAISKMQQSNINVSLPDINEAKFDFRPSVKDNKIIYGFKAIQGIGSSVANAIISHQPYTSASNFYQAMQDYKNEAPENKFGETSMIALIKAGCFDTLENRDRIEIMKDFIKSISKPLKSLSFDNIETLKELGLLSDAQLLYEYRIYKFKKYIFTKQFFRKQEGKSPNTSWYALEEKFALPYFYEHFEQQMTEDKDYINNLHKNEVWVKRGSIERVYKKLMENFKTQVLDSPEMLAKVNENRFAEIWKEKAQGTISQWEMDSLCYYYHDHELKNIDNNYYSISNFNELPETANVAEYRNFRGKEIPRFELTRICGTVIDKDKNKHTVTLLTPTDVVTVKFYKGQFGFYDKQISEVNEDREKTVLEKSWFTRGTKLLITGYRREEQFVPKKYADSMYKHTVQLILDIKSDGKLILQNDRIGSEEIEQ